MKIPHRMERHFRERYERVRRDSFARHKLTLRTKPLPTEHLSPWELYGANKEERQRRNVWHRVYRV